MSVSTIAGVGLDNLHNLLLKILFSMKLLILQALLLRISQLLILNGIAQAYSASVTLDT